MNHFIHEKALCESRNIGKGTRIWAFAHILPKAKIGDDCNICDGVFIENDVIVGNRVTIKCGVQLWDGLRVGDDVFIGPNASFSNDKFPRSGKQPEHFLETVIGRGASIGANATILPGLTIGADAMIGAGAVITGNIPPKAVVMGNPARITGYVGAKAQGVEGFTDEADSSFPVRVGVGDVELWKLRCMEDMRGSLMVAEFMQDLPFTPKRSFFVYDVPSKEVRGEHAHRECEQFLVCLNGSAHVVVDDGHSNREICLDAPDKGLYIPTMIWGIQYKFSKDAILMVMASHAYNPEEYIRDYDAFTGEVKSGERELGR